MPKRNGLYNFWRTTSRIGNKLPEFFEKYNAQVIEWGAELLPRTHATAKEMSEMYRKRIADRKELIEKIKKEQAAA